MRKIAAILNIIILLVIMRHCSTGAVVQAASVDAIDDEIQQDQVNLNTIGYTDTSTETSTQTTFTGEHIKSFTSLINIQKDGKIQVKETVNYDFTDLQKHGIYRIIPTIKTNQDGKKYRLDFSNFFVTDENATVYRYTVAKANDSQAITLKIGDPNKTITGLHTYVISYTVSGALTYFSEHDELYWNVTGNEWNVPIVKAVSQIVLPTDIKESDFKISCFTGIVNSQGINCQRLDYDRSQVVISASKTLQPSEGLTVVIGFPKGIVAVLEPQLVVPFSETFFGKLLFLGLGLLVIWWFLLYPIVIIYKWWQYGRDPKGIVGVTTAWFDPPKTPKNTRFLTPGEVGTLGDESVDMKDISSTIIDLARRGYIKIEERKKDDFYFVSTKPSAKSDFVKTKEFNGLLSFENKLLSGIFDNKKEIRLKDQKLYETVTDVTKDLYDDVVSEGLFPKNPASIRTFYSVIAMIALFTGNFFLAIVAFLFGRNMPRKTLDGVNAFNVSKSLKNFLTSQERQLEFQAKNQMMFEKLLPYAIAFGVEKVWAKRFETINLQQPDWYQGYGTTRFNSIIFANSLNSSLSSFRSSATPPPSTRSTSGFSSGFSGGFSGGGGGGGGGGSW